MTTTDWPRRPDCPALVIQIQPWTFESPAPSSPNADVRLVRFRRDPLVADLACLRRKTGTLIHRYRHDTVFLVPEWSTACRVA